MAAVVGLSPVLAESQTAFDVIKWAGAAYLLIVSIAIATAGAAARLTTPGWIGTAARYVAATASGALAVKLALSEARQA